MLAAIALGAADLRRSWRLVMAMVLMGAIPFAGFLVIDGLTRSGGFGATERSELMVQEASAVAEIVGSRIPAAVEGQLLELGAAPAIPEIHSVVGTSAEDAVLVRGVDLERYAAVEAFEVIEGRGLRPADPARRAMIGERLARARRVGIGDQIELRGKDFEVVGVFTIGTYADNEAWISIDDARALLGWGDEVSLFIIADDGPLAEGDRLDGGLVVTRKGETKRLGEAWLPVGELLAIAASAVTIASALILAAVLWRIAWNRRKELAIMRAIGLRRRINVGYLGVQSAFIAAAAFGVGLVLALVLAQFVRFHSAGFVVEPILSMSTTLTMLVGGALLAILGTALPLLWLTTRSPAEMLRRE